MVLTWRNLDLEIDVKKKGKGCSSTKTTLHILKDLSGIAKSGECLAIMGGSGAGKSTLLNIISGKFNVTSNIRLKGAVKLNGEEMTWEKFRNVIGFVMQKDIFMDVLTVREIF